MAKRRGHGEGAVYQRADGRWCASVDQGWEGGKRKRKVIYGKTRREVAEKLVVVQRTTQQGLPAQDDQITVGGFLDQWLRDVAKPTVRQTTYAGYESALRKHLKPGLGRHRLSKLTPAHVQTFMNEKVAEGLSPRTVAYLRTILRTALNRALEWGLIQRNVAALVKPPRSVSAEVEPFTAEEAKALLETLKGTRLQALFAVPLAVGLRMGEALGLRWEDVNLETGSLRVAQSLQRVKGGLIFTEPKSAKSKRTIPLPAHSLAILKTHRTRQLEERLAAGDAWHDSGLVFTTLIGTPLDSRNVRRLFHDLCEEAEIPKRRFHDLRHTCATLLLSQNVHPRVVMETLGHSQISLTLDTYSHVLAPLQRQAADEMDAVLLAIENV